MTAELLQHRHIPYDAALRQRIFTMRETGHAEFAEFAAVGRALTLVHVEAARAAMSAADLQPDDVAAIAAHGQTFFHETPNTLQWLDPALLAWHTGCAVVSDFRRADLAAGGQGAPLVPFADWLLFRHPEKNRVLLNLGGIANLTYLPAGCALEDVSAFDCGPANCLSDAICREAFGESHDADGRHAAQGVVDGVALKAFAQGRFMRATPPKSTDGPEMIAAFRTAWNETGRAWQPDANMLATANAVVALGVQTGIAATMGNDHRDLEVIAAGGGTANPVLMDQLESALRASTAKSDREVHLLRQDAVGIPADAKEAVAFALLGAATLDGEPSNVPSATGASRGVVLGAITPRP